MTSVEIDAIQILSKCTFMPGTTAKRFVRQLSCVQSEYELSDKQQDYLWILVFQYRRQHKNKWFAYYAADKIGKESPTDVKWEIEN